MGPRRVGKTVLLHHVIDHLLKEGVYSSRNIAYLSLDQPLYARMSIEELASEVEQACKPGPGHRLLVLDEIQYLPNWEWHLKAFVDAHPSVQCVASGSAAAALRLKSAESGAGRFTDFLLPPLTFHEYLDLRGNGGLVTLEADGGIFTPEIEALNQEFVCQWQLKTAHFWQLKIAHFPRKIASGFALRAGRRERSDRRPARKASRSGADHFARLRPAGSSGRPDRSRSRCSRIR